MSRPRQLALFEDQRLRLEDSIDLSLSSLREYGQRYRHWCVAYSGGKDSSATVVFVAWAVKVGLVPRPDSLSVLYVDTRMELPLLQITAMRMLETLSDDGFDARVVLPPVDERFLSICSDTACRRRRTHSAGARPCSKSSLCWRNLKACAGGQARNC